MMTLRPALLATLLATPALIAAAPASHRVTVTNTLDVARDPATVSLPASQVGAGDVWTAVTPEGEYPAQRIGDRIVFTLPMAAHAQVPVTLEPRAARPGTPFARATINVQQGGARGADDKVHGGTFHLVDHFDVPADHSIHDGIIAFEGPGWESDRVAYRLYLDARNVTDIYGKRLAGAILPRIGMGQDDYHTLADWGMDIFQVDQSLGMGGLGVLRDGMATQLGKSVIAADVVAQGPVEAAVRVTNTGFAGADGGKADLRARYAIRAGSRLTFVDAAATGAAPAMVAGLTRHEGVSVQSGGSGKWRYLATYGVQSLAHDRLGIALFYPADAVAGEGDDGRTVFVRFKDPAHIHYAFAAVWQKEPGAPQDEAGFDAWLKATVAGLDTPVGVE